MDIWKNKKGGEFKSGTWFIILLIYFSVFILIVASSEGIAGTSSTETADLSNVQYSSLLSAYYCDSPRYKYDPVTLEKDIYVGGYSAKLSCDESIGVSSSIQCEKLEGCTWENVTTGFWWFKDTTEGCTGYINSTFYGIERFNSLAFGYVISEFQSVGIWQTANKTTNNICRHPKVIENQTNCDLFSCTWTYKSSDITYNKPSSILGLVGDIFSFSYDFGFDGEDEAIIKWLLNFFLIILPLFALIITIYFMLPIVH